jgi:integrase
MSVRKRTWTTKAGERREAWVVDYLVQAGGRHIQTFDRKRDADEYCADVKVAVRHGVHTAPSQSPTVAEAAEAWLAWIEVEGREPATLKQYRSHVVYHINPRMGGERLATLTTPRINTLRDELLRDISRPLARKVVISVKAILKDAQRRGAVAQNVALPVSVRMSSRDRHKLVVGVDIPAPQEIQSLIQAATPQQRPLLAVLAFCGLRASEARALRWADVDLKQGTITVRQRADEFRNIGRPKSRAGERSIPVGPFVANTLRMWKLASERNSLDLVFPAASGGVEHLKNLVRHVLIPPQLAAGIVTATGAAKYTGLHALRHFYASWCINRKQDGGLELPIKVVQTRLGHASIAMTSDIYGHLFPRSDDGAELDAAERALGLYATS